MWPWFNWHRGCKRTTVIFCLVRNEGYSEVAAAGCGVPANDKLILLPRRRRRQSLIAGWWWCWPPLTHMVRVLCWLQTTRQLWWQAGTPAVCEGRDSVLVRLSLLPTQLIVLVRTETYYMGIQNVCRLHTMHVNRWWVDGRVSGGWMAHTRREEIATWRDLIGGHQFILRVLFR